MSTDTREALAALTYIDFYGDEKPERRKRSRNGEDPRVGHLFNGFDNVIENADDYTKGYVRAMRKEFAELIAALATQPAQPSRAQKMREAGFTARDTRLTCDECGAKFTQQFAPLHECGQPAQPSQDWATTSESPTPKYKAEGAAEDRANNPSSPDRSASSGGPVLAWPARMEFEPLRADEPVQEQVSAMDYARGWNACLSACKVLAAQPSAQGEASNKWEGAEEWMPLAWELCADECGEEACTELVWEGGPVPEPWGDRWLKYEGEAKRLIALVRKHVPAAQPSAQGEAVATVRIADGEVHIVPHMRDPELTTLRDGQPLYASAPAAPAQAVPSAQPVAHTSERHFALREAHCIKAQDDYFAARPVEDGAMQRKAFDAGFARGFDAGEKVYYTAQPVAVPAGPMTKRWCKDFPGSAAGIINTLAHKVDELEAMLEAPAMAEQVSAVTDEMVSRFLAWRLPYDFYPDCGISFDGRKDDGWNKNKTWPTGTNLLTAEQAKAMLAHVLGAAPAAPAQAVPLNFDQLQSVMSQHFGGRDLTDDEADSAEAFARAVERAHGIKAAP